MTPKEYEAKYNQLASSQRHLTKQDYIDAKTKQEKRIADGKPPSNTYQHIIDAFQVLHPEKIKIVEVS
jgi:hypothetical protein